MESWNDAELLSQYARGGSEAAFGEIVRRYANLVYSAALRQTGGAEEARDVAQMVFADLARKAKSVGGNVVLAGWLYRGVRFQSLELRRNDQRRQWRERQAMNTVDTLAGAECDWTALRRVLDDAMSNLGDDDRDALLLRFFKNESLATVGTMLGVSEDAAQKRVSRALGKLRELLALRGITSGAAALAATLAANAAESAPGGFAPSWAASALAGAPPATSGLFQLLNMKTFFALIIIGGVVAAVSLAHLRHERDDLQSALQKQATELAALQNEIEQLKARPTATTDSNNVRELARARARIQRLQTDLDSAKSRRDSLAQRLAAAGQPTNDEPTLPLIMIHSVFMTVPASGVAAVFSGKPGSLLGILDDSQARTAKSTMLTNQGGNTLSAPNVTTECGTQASIAVEEPAPYAGGTTNVGLSLDVLPQCSASSSSVALSFSFHVSGLTPAGELRFLQTNMSLSVPNGSTVVMGIPAPGDWGAAPPFSGVTDTLLVWITPTLVDPAGNLLPMGGTNESTVTANPSGVFPDGVVASPAKPGDQ